MVKKLRDKDPVEEALKVYNAKYKTDIEKTLIAPKIIGGKKRRILGDAFEHKKIRINTEKDTGTLFSQHGKSKKASKFFTTLHELEHLEQKHPMRRKKWIKGRLRQKQSLKNEIEAEAGAYNAMKDYLNKGKIPASKRFGKKVEFAAKHPFVTKKYFGKRLDDAIENPRKSATAQMLKDKLPQKYVNAGKVAANSKVGRFFGKYAKKGAKEARSFQKKPGRYMFKKQMKYGGKALGASRALAIANLNAAAEIQVDDKGILAVFQPIFWGCKIGAITAGAWYPLAIAGLIFGIVCCVWLFGLVAGYYGLFFLKCIPAVVANVFLTVGNAIWFAIHGVFTLITLGVTTLINAVFYYFIQGVLNVINWILDQPVIGWFGEGDLKFHGIEMEYRYQPLDGFAYLRPEPIKAEGTAFEIFASFFAYSFVKAGEQPWMVDENNSLIMDESFQQNGAKLEYPRLNPKAHADGFWAPLYDRPPPSHLHDFTTNFGAMLADGTMKIFPFVVYLQTMFDYDNYNPWLWGENKGGYSVPNVW